MTINGLEFSTDLSDVLEELRNQLHMNGIELLQKQPRESGNNIQIQCPYHSGGQESKPSAGIRKDTGVFHCFACQESHDLPEVISHCFGKRDLGAFGWSWLLKNFLTIQVEERKDVSLDFYRNNTQIHSSNRTDSDNIQDERFVTEEELDKYRYYHPYWEKRGIVDEKIIELFDLGVDLKSKMITFPNRNKEGKCLFVAKRSYISKFFQYPSSVQKEIYGIYELYSQRIFPDEIWITESMIDTLRLWQIGKYACALNGLGNAKQFEQLRDMPNRLFVLATDMDKAGLDARDRIKRSVRNKLFMQVFLPKNRKDIGECTDEELRSLEVEF